MALVKKYWWVLLMPLAMVVVYLLARGLWSVVVGIFAGGAVAGSAGWQHKQVSKALAAQKAASDTPTVDPSTEISEAVANGTASAGVVEKQVEAEYENDTDFALTSARARRPEDDGEDKA